VTHKARVYINFGRAIAECPFDCGSALKLEPGQTTFHCSECHMMSDVEWPDNFSDLWEALAERPAPRNRNWFPQGHTLALRSGCEHGQTPAQLREETRQNLEA